MQKDGQIVSESTIRLNVTNKIHVEQVANRLACHIIYKIRDDERSRQAATRNELEAIAKKELVKRVKVSNEVSDSR